MAAGNERLMLDTNAVSAFLKRRSATKSSERCSRRTEAPKWTTPACAASWVSIPSAPVRSCGGHGIGGLLELHPAGSQSFYTLAPRLRSAESADRGEQLSPSLLVAIAGPGL